MEKVVKLKDGTQAVMRPMVRDDLELVLAFFRQLPEDDRNYLRVDVTQRDVVLQRIKMMEAGKVKRIIAIVDDGVVAHGGLELSGDEWTSHVGELRLIVARSFQRKGLGMLMARELYTLAAAEHVEQVVVKMASPQTAARNIFHKLGFREEIVLPGHVRDMGGTAQDLIMMTCDLESLWKELEDFFADSDWQRMR